MELELDGTNEEVLRDLLGCKCKRSDTPSPFKENLKREEKKVHLKSKVQGKCLIQD